MLDVHSVSEFERREDDNANVGGSMIIMSMFCCTMPALRGHKILREIASAELGRRLATENILKTTDETEDTVSLPLIGTYDGDSTTGIVHTVNKYYLTRWA